MKRMVDTDIWADARVDGLGSMAKLLWLYILTSPQGNLAGCFELTMRRIEVDTGLKTAQAQRCLEELSAAGLISCSASTGEVLIVRWRKYNWSGGSQKLEKPLANAIASVKDDSFREYLAREYGALYGKSLPECSASKYPSDTLSGEVDRSLYLSIPNTVSNSNKGLGVQGEGEKPPRFSKPTAGQVSEYAESKGYRGFDAQRFIDYYESNGWKVGKNPMRDWKAAVRNWNRNDEKRGGAADADQFAMYRD